MIADSRIIEKKLQNNLLFLLDDSSLFSNTAYRIMQNDKNKIFVTCAQAKLNGKIQLIYFTEDYMPLSNVLEKLSEDKLINLMIDVFKRLKSLNEYGFLDVSNILQDFDKIYVDVRTLKVLFIYLPLNSNIIKIQVSVETGIKTNFIRYLQMMGKNCGKVNELLNILTDGTINIEKMIREIGCLIGKSEKTKPFPSKGKIVKYDCIYLVNKINGRLINVKKEGLIIGRNAPTEEGKILDSKKQVGRQHCKIICHDNRYYLKDLKSTNGTYLNGKKIPAMKEILLKDGDVIKIAYVELIVKSMEDEYE